ncbi:MAG: Asp-tRNA(Asn)/Glu-tRNA(Gln) amidotransferase subunit GatC [Desulfofustis sp.]|nr:Asp-tRNA(Asn)/Glu-tRNA(Gln) amidotransferase subunit GatC [Desulfofustis sp.]RZW26781.1 MAG: Asp-tRNA(Asn)/Glu-tRNA(Gln) amidotransferase subunit GatC [Desulfobulbaceae bacterium]MBT8347058.1 Asp-tRNA(Asn)/Glu-tRNA(Gln) amidotransferase subunit GatC [Desulfofustis sp.]MBT8355526.1 Asp-tRNA(Asn)/Glu-tRNA(Gln) amidotransferase subunit GatC [Desulfofustis sp.]NNF46593.1 Asp-tRNA(Asn)/Glu-tRNA(Gln) amidotransferase subunit GatC [Desulfofustis sp.]
MKITRQEVEHVAHLARLHLEGEELDLMTEQLDMILSYVAKLEELDTEGVEPTTHAFSITNAFREDVVEPSLDQEKALANGPEHNEDSFVVPRVI